jgi:hypothetical protein
MGFEDVIQMIKDGKRYKKVIIILSLTLIVLSVFGFIFTLISFFFSLFSSNRTVASVMSSIGFLLERSLYCLFWIFISTLGLISASKGKRNMTKFVPFLILNSSVCLFFDNLVHLSPWKNCSNHFGCNIGSLWKFCTILFSFIHFSPCFHFHFLVWNCVLCKFFFL